MATGPLCHKKAPTANKNNKDVILSQLHWADCHSVWSSSCSWTDSQLEEG